jgi:3-hydroxyacyl-CoA dehydrogenase
MSRFQVKKVAVLGAGVMGAQIAAHLVNVKVPVVLFDLAAKEGPKNGIVIKAVEGLKKLKPAPLGVPEDAALIQQANYEENMELLRECDLIIEAIAERMDWKTDLYHKIAPFIAEGAIVASNTSGLSITKLSEALPESIKPRFCGIHFFNPPRYMTLVELINTPTTEPKVLDDLEAFVTSALGKGVIRAHDTPNFIANRVGIASMLATIKEAETFGLSYDVVDDLTGKKLGRQLGHLPHRRRGGPGHHGPRHQDVARQPWPRQGRRPVLRCLRHAARAGQAARIEKPGPEDRRRFL